MTDVTMSIILDLAATLFLLFGLAFMFVGVLGLHRFPDSYGRLHAVTKCATLGLLGMLVAAILHIGVASIITKALMTIIFVFIANPVGSHMLAKAAHHARYHKWERTLSDDLEEDKAAGRLGKRGSKTEDEDAEFAAVAADGEEREPALREAV